MVTEVSQMTQLVPAVLAVTMAVRCAFCKVQSVTKYLLLRIRWVSQAQNAPKLRFQQGLCPGLCWGAYNAPRTHWERGTHFHSFGVSIKGTDSTATSFFLQNKH